MSKRKMLLIVPHQDDEMLVGGGVLYQFAKDQKIKRIDDYILRFYLGGESTTDYKKILGRKQKQALVDCWMSNGLKAPIGIAYRKWLWKSVQFVWKFIS